MKRNKSYTFKQIEQFANEYGFLLTEVGGNTVGTSFITLEHLDKNFTISFVLDGWTGGNGNQYTCIYSDYI